MNGNRYSPYFSTQSKSSNETESPRTEPISNQYPNGNSTSIKSPKKKQQQSKEERKAYEEKRLRSPDKRFGGLTEEQVKKLLLPDRLADNLDVLFIGINPGLMSAYKGHHYCSANNHFWPLLHESGLIGEPLIYSEDEKCLLYGIGLTNMVARTTRSAAELSRNEIKEGREASLKMIKNSNPLVVCFNGKGIYEIFADKKRCTVGLQEDIGNSAVYVMPSTSGLVAQYPRKADKLIFFQELKKLRDERKARRLEPPKEDVISH